MPTLDEQFEQWWENPNSSASELHLPDEDAARIAFAAGKLAGATAELKAIIAIVAECYPTETQNAMAAVAKINYYIRQRGEEGK